MLPFSHASGSTDLAILFVRIHQHHAKPWYDNVATYETDEEGCEDEYEKMDWLLRRRRLQVCAA